MRAMTRMETTTYSESVSSTPNIGFSASTGPMQNGMTYIVRPRMHPRYSSVMTDFISAGSIQLLVGPASASSTEQMKVRSSTRATSLGSEAHQNELGFLSRRVKVPASTSCWVSRSHSSSLPSTHTTRSGVVSSAISRTQASSRAWVVGALSRPGVATEVTASPSSGYTGRGAAGAGARPAQLSSGPPDARPDSGVGIRRAYKRRTPL